MVAAGVGCTLLPRLAAMPGVGSVDHGLVEIRRFARAGADAHHRPGLAPWLPARGRDPQRWAS